MPLYEYQCENCGTRFEVIQKFSDPPVESCRNCGGPVHRLLSAPAIQFKGTGWYITDYARKGKGEGETATVAASHSNGSNGSGGSTSEAGGAASGTNPPASTSSGTTPTTETKKT